MTGVILVRMLLKPLSPEGTPAPGGHVGGLQGLGDGEGKREGEGPPRGAPPGRPRLAYAVSQALWAAMAWYVTPASRVAWTAPSKQSTSRSW